MKLLKVILENFLSHKFTTVDFPDGLIGIIGHNGSGKSSLVKESVTWCLWGKSRSTGAGDDLIWEDALECSVKVEFLVNGKKFRVARTRERNKKTSLELTRVFDNDQWDDLTGPTLKDTQELINKSLGMVYEVFINSCCIEQGKFDSFSKLTPKEASLVILNILQLDKYNTYKVKATDKFIQSKVIADKLESANIYLQSRLLEISNTNKSKDEKTKVLEDLKIKYDNAQTDYKAVELKYRDLEIKYHKLSDSKKESEGSLKEIDSNLEKLSKQANLLDDTDTNCPVCKTELNDEKKLLVKETFRLAYQTLLDKQLNLNDKIKLLEISMKDTTDKLDTLGIIQKRDLVSSTFSRISTLEGELSVLTSSTQDIAEIQKTLNKNIKEHERSLVDQLIYSELAQAFSHKGIPLLIIDNVLRELEVLVNENLKLLSNLPITIEFATQRESIAGDILDTFQILIRNNLDKRPYTNYSGGEQVLIDLSIRLGLSELLARRNNFKIETLIIDEGLGSLDEENQSNFLETLRFLTSKFSQVLVITHTSIKDYFNQYIELEKINKISKVGFSTNLCYNRARE